MIQEVRKAWGAFKATRGENPHSLAIMEGPTNCNRACNYCSVHTKSSVDEVSTLAQTRTQIDWLWKQGYRVLNYVGGEPLAECKEKGEIISRKYHRCERGVAACAFIESEEREENAFYRTKDGITFAEHTLGVVKYASRKGMLTNVTTNGDFLKPWSSDILRKLKNAGLDTLTFSLHSYNEAGLKNIIGKARAAAQEGLVPIVSVVFTADRADTIPLYARTCAANGLLFSTSIVQEIGSGFSAVSSESQIPSADQQRAVFAGLLPLKKAGLVLNNWRYLTEAVDFPDNSWKCNPDKDSFVHIRTKGEHGKIGFCPEMPSGFHTYEIDLTSAQWRQKKRDMIESCKGCLYSCYFQCENPDYTNDLRTLMSAILIKSGHAGIVRRLGERSVGKTPEVIPVPQSELEKFQAEIKDYYKLHNKIKRRGLDLISTLATPFVYTFAAAVLGLIYLQARRKGISSDEVSRALLASMVYPGLLDSNEKDS